MPKLSICIPTYKRSQLLAELLDSIIAQGIPDIEVIVSDDASPDDTADVAQGYYARIPHFTFIRQPENIGLDRNFLAVVEAATGDYVWLMGDERPYRARRRSPRDGGTRSLARRDRVDRGCHRLRPHPCVTQPAFA